MRPGSDAAVVRVPCEKDGTTIEKLLAFAVDCNGRMCELDPFAGGAMAVAEVCRNLVVHAAPSPSASPTASTSATPSGPR